MNLNKKIIPLIGFVLIFIVSCTTPLKELTYMDGIEPGRTYVNGPLPDEYRIRSNDQLFIQVISDDPISAAFLNLTNTQTSSAAGSSAGSLELITFMVSEEGYIDYPQLGQLEVKGLTLRQTKELIQSGVDKYLQGASVFVKLVNRTVTILGQVVSPGQKQMLKSRMTIFEALGVAGDITDWGNRGNVKLIRETPRGTHVEELNLLDSNIINSPYYYILPHDVVYVEHATKVYGAKNLGYATPLSIGASVVSIGVLILNLLVK